MAFHLSGSVETRRGRFRRSVEAILTLAILAGKAALWLGMLRLADRLGQALAY
jgi:hypothetical protein